MRRSLLVALLLVAAPASAIRPKQLSPDEMAIQKLQADFDAAWNARNAPALTDLFLPDADVMDPGGGGFNGRADIGVMLEKQLAGKATLAHTCWRTRFIGNDVALLDCNWSLTVKGVGERDHVQRGFYTEIAQRDGKAWKIAAMRVWMPAK